MRPIRVRPITTSTAGQPIAQRQPTQSVITALSGGPSTDGSSQISAYSPNTRGRSCSSNRAPIAPKPKPASSPAAMPRTTVPASTQPMVGANTASAAPTTYSAVATTSTRSGGTRCRIGAVNDSINTAATEPAASVAPNRAKPSRSRAITGSTVL